MYKYDTLSMQLDIMLCDASRIWHEVDNGEVIGADWQITAPDYDPESLYNLGAWIGIDLELHLSFEMTFQLV